MGPVEEEGHQPSDEDPHLAACSATVGIDPFNNNCEHILLG